MAADKRNIGSEILEGLQQLKRGERGQVFEWPGPPVVHSDPDFLGGTPVFVGTRVPVQSLFDYLEAGGPLDEFLRQFPSVRREQAIAALERASAC